METLLQSSPLPPLPKSRSRVPDAATLNLTAPYEGQAVMTPETANEWLVRLNIKNRRKRSPLVLYLVQQIKNGEWQSDHPQPIVLSDQPRLIDGQHRLFAIVEAGVPVVVKLVLGARDGLREYIDTGISRGLEDRVEFDPDPILNRQISQIVSTHFYMTMEKFRRPTPNEAFDIYGKNSDGIRFAAQHARHKRERGATRAPVMVALSEMYQRDAEKATTFAEALATVASTVQQAAHLRDYLLRNVSAGGRMSALDNYHKAIGAMKAYLDGREVVQLRAANW